MKMSEVDGAITAHVKLYNGERPTKLRVGRYAANKLEEAYRDQQQEKGNPYGRKDRDNFLDELKEGKAVLRGLRVTYDPYAKPGLVEVS